MSVTVTSRSVAASATARRTFGPVPDDPEDRRLYFKARSKASMRPVTEPQMRKNAAQRWVVYAPEGSITAGEHVSIRVKGRDPRVVFITSLGTPFVRDGVRMVYGYLQITPDTSAAAAKHDTARCNICTPYA